MSKGLFYYEPSVIKYDEEQRLRTTRPLDPRRAMLHNRDVQSLSMRPDTDSSPEPVKQEEDEVPLELPFNTVIVKNEFDLAKFSPLKPGRARERSEWTSEEEEEEEEESEGESEAEESGGEEPGGEEPGGEEPGGEEPGGEEPGGEEPGGEEPGAEEPGCSVDSKAGTKGHELSLFDTDDSDDCEPPAKRTRKEDGQAEELTQKGVQSLAPNQDIYQFVFHNGVSEDKRQEPRKNLDSSEDKPTPGSSSDAARLKADDVSITKTKSDSDAAHILNRTKNSKEQESPPTKNPPKERKRAPATFNGTVDKTKHQCSECHKYFQCEAHLQRHMLIHYGLKPFECPVCDKAFRYKSSYKAHLNMHTEEKPLTCSLCHKGFTQSRDLKRHMLSHTDEKNFDCPECGGKFKHKHNLIRHISVIHKAEKPYPCPMCEKAFAQKHDFMTHMRTHSGEKPFSCQVCSRSFGAKGTLRTHMKVHRKRVAKELPAALAFGDFMSEEKGVCN